MSKETFKLFARKHPELASRVTRNEVSWQKLYEIYDIYGEDSSVWDSYFANDNLFSFIKNIDVKSVQKGISNIERVINLLQELGFSNKKEDYYEPRPIYKRFED